MHPIRNAVSLALICFLLICVVTACSKSDPAEPDTPDTFVPATYPQGLPDGGFAEKSVNAAGSTLASTDGKLKVVIPAGALSASTVITVQAITNTSPLGTGSSFRILPADLSLSKPVAITLTYNESELDGLDEEALDLITQDATGTWKRMKKTQLNKSNKTLTVETSHLGDFSFTGNYRLRGDKSALSAGEVSVLTVQSIQEKNSDEDDEEAIFGSVIPINQSADFESWNATGPGNIVSGGATAEFTAPSSISDLSEADIRVSLKNIRHGLRSSNGKLLLRKKITITPASFMAGYYDGQPFTCIGVSVLAAGGITTIQGVTADGKSVLIFVNGTDVGTYPFGNPSQAGKAEMRCNITGDVYETVYTVCGPPSSTHYSTGDMLIKGYQNGGQVAGEFSATLYDDSGCQIRTKTISGSFRVKQ